MHSDLTCLQSVILRSSRPMIIWRARVRWKLGQSWLVSRSPRRGVDSHGFPEGLFNWTADLGISKSPPAATGPVRRPANDFDIDIWVVESFPVNTPNETIGHRPYQLIEILPSLSTDEFLSSPWSISSFPHTFLLYPRKVQIEASVNQSLPRLASKPSWSWRTFLVIGCWEDFFLWWLSYELLLLSYGQNEELRAENPQILQAELRERWFQV